MNIILSWWIIPGVLTLFFGYKAWPKDERYSSGNFSHMEIDNFIRLFWLLPLFFIWAVYFCVMYFTS